MKNQIFIAVLTILLLISSSIQIYGANSISTFTNDKETAPNLYVTKNVAASNPAYKIPDGEFGFVLKLKGVLADRGEYRVFDSDGNEVFNTVGGNKVPYVTSRSGDFSLKGGQTALFEYVGAGTDYEVTESGQAAGFTQTAPAGGLPAKGTVLPDGANANFTNTYTPPTSTTSVNTSIEVNKAVVFPEGYTPPTSPDFTYTIKVDDNIYSPEKYSVIDTSTGLVSGNGITTTDGSFTIKAGQKALFANVPANVDYEITEKTMAGWNIVGNATVAGATKAPLTSVYYTNSNVSFGVSKTVSGTGANPNEVFQFKLTDAKRSAMPNMNYYLYNRDGTRIDNTMHSTDASGMFTLKANQVAIFASLPKDSTYNVSEVNNPQYTQTVPASHDGYTDKVVSDSFEMLPFVNTYIDLKGALSVSKAVTPGPGSQMPMTVDDFNFVLTHKNAQGGYDPVPNSVYTVAAGTGSASYQTDAQGKFTIKRNETAVFRRLMADETYRVEEVDLSKDYTIDQPVTEGALTNSLTFIFNNKFDHKPINITVNKENSDQEPMGGARFDVYADEALNSKVNENPLISDSEGKMSLTNMKPGTYYLKETEAPSGYRLLTDPLKIEMVRTGNELKVNIDEKDASILKAIDVRDAGERDEVTLSLTNYHIFELPLAGGMGKTIPLAIGFVGIIIVSALILRKRIKL